MTSRGYILSACWVVMILHWTTDMFPGGIVPLAFCASWLIMEWSGMFKRELANAKPVEKDERSQRQIDFMRKLEEGKLGLYDPEAEELQAKIIIMDEDGNESSVIIKPDGTVETEGKPDPDVIEAVKMLRQSVIDHGPEAVADELGRQIEKIKNGEK